MRIASWNVNSAKARAERLLHWLDDRAPDVVCLQETKLASDAFSALLGTELSRRGYLFASHGQTDGRNGVAILSRVGLTDVRNGLPDEPLLPGDRRPQARAIAATCGGLRVQSIYVPNGQRLNCPAYAYKLAWLQALRADLATVPGPLAVCGDVNVAPTDADIYDPAAADMQTHVSAPVRAAISALGLCDLVRDRWPHERIFTCWDYRLRKFRDDYGLRIDLILTDSTSAARACAAWVDRQARKQGDHKSKPSDHAPVIVDLDQAPDGDIGPVVPPATAPATIRGSR